MQELELMLREKYGLPADVVAAPAQTAPAESALTEEETDEN